MTYRVQERVVRIYSKSDDAGVIRAIQKAFRRYLKRFKYELTVNNRERMYMRARARECLRGCASACVRSQHAWGVSMLVAASAAREIICPKGGMFMHASLPFHLPLCRSTIDMEPDPASRVHHLDMAERMMHPDIQGSLYDDAAILRSASRHRSELDDDDLHSFSQRSSVAVGLPARLHAFPEHVSGAAAARGISSSQASNVSTSRLNASAPYMAVHGFPGIARARSGLHTSAHDGASSASRTSSQTGATSAGAGEHSARPHTIAEESAGDDHGDASVHADGWRAAHPRCAAGRALVAAHRR
ncbi:hypothetical protein EON62_01940 [archaeon]|nr:MAG: hypothetical protein EON62_01940 [archaeon]